MSRPTAPLGPRAAANACALVLGACSVWFFNRLGFDVPATLNVFLRPPWTPLPGGSVLSGALARGACAAAICAACWGAGRFLLRALKVPAREGAERAALAFGLGAGAFGTAFLLAGLAGLWGKPLFMAALGGGLLLAAIQSRQPAAWGEPWSALERALLGLTAAYWLFALRLTVMPPRFFDALEYHLALPNLYLLAGKIVPTPENSYAGVPALPQMLFGWAQAFDPWSSAAAMLHAAFLPWTALSLIALSRRLGRGAAGAAAALAFTLTPVVFGEIVRPSVAMEGALLQLLGLLALLAAAREKERRPWLLLAGLFFGFSMSTKYTAWLLPPALLPLVWRGRLSWRDAGVAAGAAALVLAPWVLKNAAFYGNPLYPFFHDTLARGAAFMPDWRQVSGAKASLAGLLGFLMPGDGGIGQSIGLLVPTLLPLLFMEKLDETEKDLAWYCALSWLPLLLLSPYPRYFIPHLPPLLLLYACVGFRQAPSYGRRALGWVAAAAAAAAVFPLVISATLGPDREAFLGRAPFGQWLVDADNGYPTPPYAGIAFVNAQEDPGRRVLLHGDARSHYSSRPALASSPDQRPVLYVWAEQASSVEELARRVSGEGVLYLIANWGELARSGAFPALEPAAAGRLMRYLTAHATKVHEAMLPKNHWVTVYRLDPRPSATAALDETFSFFILRAPPR
jgi:hypothetical protein